MNHYELFSWEKEGLFRETHYIRKSSGWRNNLFICCDMLFESIWFPAYQPPHYAIPKTLYELIVDGNYCHMDRDRMVTELHPGDWVVTHLESEPPGRYDKVLCPSLHRIGLLAGAAPVHELLSRRLFPEKRVILHADDPAPFHQLLHRLREEMRGEGDDEKISLMMVELLQKIAGLRREKTASSHRFSEILQECQSSAWSNSAQLAAHLGMSGRTLTRLFKANLETTPGRYLAETRLEKAKSLLAVPDLEIKEIARLCGYSSANFMTRCFRSRYRITPSEYRQGETVHVAKRSD